MTLTFAAAMLLQATLVSSEGLAKMSQRELNAISVECGTPKRWLRAREQGEVTFRPPASANFEKVDCLIRKLRPTVATKIGYIGNDAYEAGK